MFHTHSLCFFCVFRDRLSQYPHIDNYVSGFNSECLTLRLLMSYIYIYIYIYIYKITRPEESYRLCCVVVCDLETSRMGAPYIYI